MGNEYMTRGCSVPLAWHGPRAALLVTVVTLVVLQVRSIDTPWYTDSGLRRQLPYISETADPEVNRMIFLIGNILSSIGLLAAVPWFRRMHVYQLRRVPASERRTPPAFCGVFKCISEERQSVAAAIMAPLACLALIGTAYFNVSAALYIHWACAIAFFFFLVMYTRALLSIRYSYVADPKDMRYRVGRAAYYVSWFSLLAMGWTYVFDPSGTVSSIFQHILVISLGYGSVRLSNDLFEYDPAVLSAVDVTDPGVGPGKRPADINDVTVDHVHVEADPVILYPEV